jgi:parallel beta-helix repeat protein
MGYTLKGPDSGEKSGIYIDPLSNVEVRNGTIRDFGWWPIYAKYGNETSGSHRVINIRALSNGFGIVLFGKGNLVKDCTAGYNVGSFGGIYGGWGGTVTGNTAYNNGGHGIRAADGSTVTGNTAYYNEGDGIGTDSNCTVAGNTVSNNKDNGIETASGCTVTGNTANYNNRSDSSDFAGIYVTDDCMVKGNTCHGNKRNNIYVDGSDNAIEEHLLTDCSPGNGIYFNDIGNFYANNRFSGNDTDVANPGFQTNGGGNYPF